MYQMDIGAPELLIILAVVLLIFGPGRILKISQELGQGIRQFRKGLDTPPEPEPEDAKKAPE
jgi:sec-independent protein translocase protein TatA